LHFKITNGLNFRGSQVPAMPWRRRKRSLSPEKPVEATKIEEALVYDVNSVMDDDLRPSTPPLGTVRNSLLEPSEPPTPLKNGQPPSLASTLLNSRIRTSSIGKESPNMKSNNENSLRESTNGSILEKDSIKEKVQSPVREGNRTSGIGFKSVIRAMSITNKKKSEFEDDRYSSLPSTPSPTNNRGATIVAAPVTGSTSSEENDDDVETPPHRQSPNPLTNQDKKTVRQAARKLLKLERAARAQEKKEQRQERRQEKAAKRAEAVAEKLEQQRLDKIQKEKSAGMRETFTQSLKNRATSRIADEMLFK
jgi:hypothetical protein